MRTFGFADIAFDASKNAKAKIATQRKKRVCAEKRKKVPMHEKEKTFDSKNKEKTRCIAIQIVESSESTPGRARDATGTAAIVGSSSSRGKGGTSLEKATGPGGFSVRTALPTRGEHVHQREVLAVQILPEDGVEALAVVRGVRLLQKRREKCVST